MDGEIGLEDLAELSDVLLTRPNFSDQQAEHLALRALHCQQGRWSGGRLYGLRCSDVSFIECDLSNASWEKLIAHRLEFSGCQLVGWNALEAYLQDLSFRTCNAQFAAFRFATCKCVRFERCDLRHADFQGADLSGVVFSHCDLSHAQLSGTSLKGTDFRGSTIENVRVGIPELAGAIVDPLQAAYIAGLIGVVIKQEHEE